MPVPPLPIVKGFVSERDVNDGVEVTATVIEPAAFVITAFDP